MKSSYKIRLFTKLFILMLITICWTDIEWDFCHEVITISYLMLLETLKHCKKVDWKKKTNIEKKLIEKYNYTITHKQK